MEGKRLSSRNPELQAIFGMIPRLACSTANVLVLGESGTGKELVARLLHESGPRKSKKFVAVNCAAMPESLLESELFGHEKGAFTGASSFRRGLVHDAEGGTLFLDEIGDMPLQLQAKLLRVLQERAVRPVGANSCTSIDFRLVAATHRDLHAAISNGEFRADLFYRLNVVPLHIPPLRRRKRDIADLAKTFIERVALREGRRAPQLLPCAIRELERRPWKGNVRELENVIERLVVLSEDLGEIYAKDLPVEDDNFTVQGSDANLQTVDALVQQYILFVYELVGKHQGRAAEILGLSRRTLYRRLHLKNEAQSAASDLELVSDLSTAH